MRKHCINFLMRIMREQCNGYTNDQFEIIQYGLESIYILITKLVVLTLIASLLGVFQEYLIFMALFGGIRTSAFGLHAKKSWMCYISSTLCFVVIPWLCTLFEMSLIWKIFIGVICIYYIHKYAPADTENRPIVSEKRRKLFKILSTITASIYVIGAAFTTGFIANSLLFSLVEQCFVISPRIYKIFKLPYANYKQFLCEA